MRMRTTLTLAVLGVAAALTLLLATEEWGLGEQKAGLRELSFLLEDTADRYVYQQRGRWLPAGRLPYLEEHSEYPQLATWLFGLPYLFFDHHVPVARQQTVDELRMQVEDRRHYFDLHHVSMALSLLALIALTAANLRALGHRPGWALLLFLPGTLYFSFNRFDAWPAAFVALAFLMQWQGRRHGAMAALGLGAMVKWYPILLVPLFLAHNLGAERARGRGFVASLPRAVLAPGLVAGAVCVAIMGVTYLHGGGGMDAVNYVYQHHADRGHNPSSIVAALVEPVRWGWFDLDQRDGVAGVLQVLQFAPALLLALLPIRSRDSLLLGSLVVVLAFAQFGRVFSPQWVCWISPIAVLLAPRRRIALLLMVGLELLIYLQVPLLYYEAWGRLGALDAQAKAFWLVCDMRIGALLLFWAWSLVAFLRTVVRPPPSPAQPA